MASSNRKLVEWSLLLSNPILLGPTVLFLNLHGFLKGNPSRVQYAAGVVLPVEGMPRAPVIVVAEPLPSESSIGVPEIAPAESSVMGSETVPSESSVGRPMVPTSLLLKGPQPQSASPVFDRRFKKHDPGDFGGSLGGKVSNGGFLAAIKGRVWYFIFCFCKYYYFFYFGVCG